MRMETTAESARERASRQATEWLILLQDEPDATDVRRRFDAWRAADPLNEAAWTDIQALLGLTAAKAPVHSDLWQPFIAHSRSTARGSAPPGVELVAWVKRRWLLLAMASAAACTMAIVAAPAALVWLKADYMTATAEQRRVELSDGSEMVLAPGSAVAVSFSMGNRDVRLIEGEAFFHVKPDKARPFQVVAGSVNATVLGTSFDVRRDGAGVGVSVQDGIVQVAPSNDASFVPERLEAGQSVQVSWMGELKRTSELPQFVAAWRRGQLVAHEQRLGDAVEQLRRYYVGKIVLADDALGERRITGIYNLSDPEEALRGIARAHGARVRRITPWILVVTGS